MTKSKNAMKYRNNREAQNIEFKTTWRDEYLKAICAFANAEGGKLIIGVDDKGDPIGVKNPKKLLEDTPNKVKDILGIIPKVIIEKRKSKDVMVIEIEPSHAPISYKGNFFVRSGSTTQELKNKELTRFLISKSDRDWDEYVEEKSSIEDINIETIERFKEIAVKRLPFVKEEKDNLEFLEKLNLLEDGKIKRAGILLFGKNPKKFYTSAYIKIGKFLTNTDILSTDDVEGNLFEQVEKAIELLRVKYLISEIKFEGIYRKEVLEYPEEALREAIINAIIHRNYVGAHTQLKIYPDKLILWNEGILPKEIKIQDLKKNHPSRPRNELLADVFFKAGLIEAWGRGTIKIIDECKKTGLPEPEFREEFGGFSVYFYKDIYTEENLRKIGLNERQIRAVMYVKKKGEITNKEYQEIANTTKKTASRDLGNLVEKEVFNQVGTTGKGTYYVLEKTKGTQRGHKGDKWSIKEAKD